jgi:ABC-2 type transport system ATP-binding protein
VTQRNASAIEFRNVSRVYRRFPSRQTIAVADVSLAFQPGEVIGIAGPNGAGKSTLIAMLLGFLRPTTGEIIIGGLSPRQYVERSGVGYLPETLTINREWTVEVSLRRLGALGGLDAAELRPRIAELLVEFDLLEWRDKLVRELSKGMQQRLGIALAVLGDNQIMVFDEPSHGLDPIWTLRFREVVRRCRTPERVIIVASHNLDELERLADRVLVMDRGKVQTIIDLHQATSRLRAYRLELLTGEEHVLVVFPTALRIDGGGFELPPMDIADLNRGLALLLAKGALLSHVAPTRARLEQEFMPAVSR